MQVTLVGNNFLYQISKKLNLVTPSVNTENNRPFHPQINPTIWGGHLAKSTKNVKCSIAFHSVIPLLGIYPTSIAIKRCQD